MQNTVLDHGDILLTSYKGNNTRPTRSLWKIQHEGMGPFKHEENKPYSLPTYLYAFIC